MTFILNFNLFLQFCQWLISSLSSFLSFSHYLCIWWWKHWKIRITLGIRITLLIHMYSTALCSYSAPNQMTVFRPKNFESTESIFSHSWKTTGGDHIVFCIIFAYKDCAKFLRNFAEANSLPFSSSVGKNVGLYSLPPFPHLTHLQLIFYPIAPLNCSYCSC